MTELEEKIRSVQNLTDCSYEEAKKALLDHDKEVWLAVDALLTKPPVAGDKYLLQKPKIDTGLTPEQEERCKKGRWLQDKVNAVFSVAHSKIQSQPAVEGCLSNEAYSVETSLESPPASSQPLSLPDAPEKTIPPSPQYELPLKTDS